MARARAFDLCGTVSFLPTRFSNKLKVVLRYGFFFMISGVDGLRVVDASIFPQIPSGNLNAPTIMTAERMSDLIKNKTPLPPANVPVYQPPQLETRR